VVGHPGFRIPPSPGRHLDAVGPVAADVVAGLAAHVVVDAELRLPDNQLLLWVGEHHCLKEGRSRM